MSTTKLPPVQQPQPTKSTTLTTPASFSNTHLPAILCLHGGGSNSTVFRIQARRLVWNLSSQFRFVFVQGPFDSAPGHGMLPVFEPCAPFYRWVSKVYVAGGGGLENDMTEETPESEVRAVDEVLRKVIEENGGVEGFAGVMGFSMGARMVAGLLLRQLVEERDRGECWTKFKFGVMIGGPFPPIGLTDIVDAKDYDLLTTVSTVHAWGRDDHVKERSQQLRKTCEGDACFHMEFEGGHHLPLKDAEARQLANLIKGAFYAADGQRQPIVDKAPMVKSSS